MEDMKIFVSHRVDINSYVVENEIFKPIFCGAEKGVSSNLSLQGDNTGGNISSKKNYYSELTVQYWAWKNESYSYMGLCHYRRFLNFSKRKLHRKNPWGQKEFPLLCQYYIKKISLNKPKDIRKIIREYDVIFNESVDIRKIPTKDGFKNTVYEHWESQDQPLIDFFFFDIFLQLIREHDESLYQSAQDYLSNYHYRGFNCYIMCKEVFDNFCKSEFSILFQLEKIIFKTNRQQPDRTMGYWGELFYGIYAYNLEKKSHYRTLSLQLIYFQDTFDYSLIYKNKICLFFKKATIILKSNFVNFVNFYIIPYSSKRREFIKNLLKPILKRI